VRPKYEARASQRCRFDDPSAGPSHALQVEADGGMDDFRCPLEVLLQGLCYH
jgi:hypothetical protein